MLEIYNNMIRVTRGDTIDLSVSLKHHDGSPYVMQTGDTLTFTVRKQYDGDVLLQAVSSTNTISVTPEQSKNLEVGDCCYDIELKTGGGGVYTVAGVNDYLRSNMRVWPEVTQ